MTSQTPDVVCVGILVADMFAPPLRQLPGPGELALADEILLQTGGCAANTGADLARLGVRTAVVGKVGDDVFADFIRRDLRAKGLDASGIGTAAAAPTSRTIILPVVGEDRRYIHCIGANADLGPDDVDLDVVAGARALYVGGYRLLPGLGTEALAGLFRFAQEHGVRTVLDVAGVKREEGLAPFRTVLPYTDAFLPNEDEAGLITGEADPERQAAALVDCGASTVVITLGARGALARTQGVVVRLGVYPTRVVDPSGSGDAFDAGFIVGLLEGWDLPRTLRFAAAIGASACTRLGCTAGVFTRPEALAYVERNPLESESRPARP